MRFCGFSVMGLVICLVGCAGTETDVRLQEAVEQMNICHLTSQNKEFYDWKLKAENMLEEGKGWGEYHFVCAEFYRDMQQEDEARRAAS